MKEQETIVFKNAKQFKKFLRKVDIMPTAYNRAVKPQHALKMQKSLEQIKVQRAINIIETDVFEGVTKQYIADGQHLRKAILNTDDDKLGKHLVAFISKTDSLGDIIPFISKMNSTAKNWTSDDYLDSWATHGLENYIYIKKRKAETKLSTSTLVTEIYGRSVSHKVIQEFKEGTLTINKAQGNDIIRTYNNALELGLSKNSGSLVATCRLLKLYPSIKGDYLNMIKKNGKTFQHKLNRDAYFTLFKNFLGLKDKKKTNK